MPTIEALQDALIKADSAGDTESAQIFADMIKEARSAPTVYPNETEQNKLDRILRKGRQIAGLEPITEESKASELSNEALQSELEKAKSGEFQGDKKSAQLADVYRKEVLKRQGQETPPKAESQPIVGAAETALTAATGATGGLAGMIEGFAEGIAKEVSSGKFGTDEAAKRIEELAMDRAASLTYQPRTETGKQLTQTIGEVGAALTPILPMSPEISALSKGVAPQVAAKSQQVISTSTKPALTAISRTTKALAQKISDSAKQKLSKLRTKPTEKEQTSVDKEAREPLVPKEKQDDVIVSMERVTGKGGFDPESQAIARAIVQGDTNEIIKYAKINDEKRRQFEEAGIENPDLAYISDNPKFVEIYQAARSQIGEALSNESDRVVQTLSKETPKVIEKAGGFTDVSTLNVVTRQKFNEKYENLNELQEDAFNRLDELVDPARPVRANRTNTFLKQRLKELGGKKSRLSPRERKLMSELDRKENPTVEYINQERKAIGAALDGKNSDYANVNEGTLRKLYGLLLGDERAAMRTAGKGALKAFDEARGISVKKFELRDQGTKLFGKLQGGQFVGNFSDKVTSGVSAAMKGNNEVLENILRQVTDLQTKKDIISTGLNRIFSPGGGILPEKIPLARAAENFAKLRKNAGFKKMVIDNLGKESWDRVDNLTRVMEQAAIINQKKITMEKYKSYRDLVASTIPTLEKMKITGLGKVKDAFGALIDRYVPVVEVSKSPSAVDIAEAAAIKNLQNPDMLRIVMLGQKVQK